MKKLAKVLAVASILALASFSFVSCGEDDDDENGMLSGSNNDYSIDYNNDSSSVSRGYNTTTFKHLGSLCQMTMNKSSAGSGAVGYIWDLESNSAREEKDPRRFFIFGFNYGLTGGDNKVAYYLSLYKNVTDIQLQNFGATGGTNKETGDYTAPAEPATEKEYIALNATNSFEPTIDGDGNFVVTVNVYEGTWDSDGTWENSATTYKKGDYNGTYIVDIYNGKFEKADLASATPVKSFTIPAEDIGYVTTADNKTTVTGNSSRQKNGAVYANVYGGKHLTASWHYADTYSEAEVVEE